MKRVALIAVAATTLATGVWAQSSQSAIDTAVLAAPANMKDTAMVIKWKPDYTYDVLRPASNNNKLVCFDKSGMPGQLAFSIECTSQANLPRVAQNLKFEAMPEKGKTAIAAAVQAIVGVARTVQIERRRDEVLPYESGIERDEVPEAADEQQRADDENERERHL